MGRRRFCWIQGGKQYEFAVIYYKDAGDSKTVWLRDGNAAPVQIAVWPKRAPLFDVQSLSTTTILIQGYVIYVGGEDRSIDDERTFSRPPSGIYKNTVEVVAMPQSTSSGTSTIQMNFSGESLILARSSSFVTPFNYAGFVPLGSDSSISTPAALFSQTSTSAGATITWDLGYTSISNKYGVFGLTKIPGKTLFSILDKVPVSASPISGTPRVGRVTFGSIGSVSELDWPNIPTYDSDFVGQGAASATYNGGLESWVDNTGPGFSTQTSFDQSDLIGTAEGAVLVTQDSVTTETTMAGIDAGADNIIALVAMPI